MPVPKSSADSSPRRLLRDVVFDKMLGAIQDGTLQRGERLNDDELVRWLGVSRTPIREAIAKLVDLGLVEMEANRYTRVATPTVEDYTSALQMFVGLQELAVRWGLGKLDDAGVAAIRADIDRARKHAAEHDAAVLGDLLAIFRTLVIAADNRTLTPVAKTLAQRVPFLAVPETEHFAWDLDTYLDGLEAALDPRDPDAGGRAVRSLFDLVDEHVAALLASR